MLLADRIPSIDYTAQTIASLGVLQSKVGRLVRVILQVVMPQWHFVPKVHIAVTSGIFTRVSQNQFPVTFDTPEVLKGIVGIPHGEIMNGMCHTENAFPTGPGNRVHQVDTRKIVRGVDAGRLGKRGYTTIK